MPTSYKDFKEQVFTVATEHYHLPLDRTLWDHLSDDQPVAAALLQRTPEKVALLKRAIAKISRVDVDHHFPLDSDVVTLGRVYAAMRKPDA